MKILLHCRPGYNRFFIAAIKEALDSGTDIQWSVLLYSNADNSLSEYQKLVGKENVYYLQDKLSSYMDESRVDMNSLKDLPVSLFECIASSKIVSGHIPLACKPRDYQIKIVSGTYKIYSEFLRECNPDFVFFPVIELYDTVLLYHMCLEKKIGTIIYSHARNLNVSYFSDSLYEELPAYALTGSIPEDYSRKTAEFIQSFRTSFKKSFKVKYEPRDEEVVGEEYPNKNIFEKGTGFILKRCSALFGMDKTFEKHVVDGYTFFHRLRIHFLPVTVKYRSFKGLLMKRFYDIRSLKALPEKFIYYPLQYTPEVSINIPAPYFIDQMRAVDMILNAMPADHYLVVKEHPAMRGIRPSSFYRALKQKCNILVADDSLASIEVTKKAALTVSVTGTACLEALLLGKPSLQLGRSFFSNWVYRMEKTDELARTIRDAINSKSVPIERITDLVSRVFSVGGDYILFSPSDPYLKAELVMNRKNINEFLRHLVKHMDMDVKNRSRA